MAALPIFVVSNRERTGMKAEQEEFTPVPGHQEAVHRARVLAKLVEEQLLGHPALATNFFWRNKAEQALDALSDLAAALEAGSPRRRSADAPGGRGQAPGATMPHAEI
ncbi:MAG: hypothetical protein DI532_00015 [Azospirillum brasilense]|nr:MAG: hypothetical protein DI532_00015 [Azospirillum brasilense]